MDFGLAKDVEADTRVTRSGIALGTPSYMPPEQAEGRIRDIDGRSDVYSLGATLYEMLTLQPPFEGTTVAEVLRKALFQDPVPLRKLRPGLDADLETICLRCLEKDPSKRYAGARELAEDLGFYLEGSPIRAKPVTFLERLVKRGRRNKPAVAALAALALLAGAGAVAAWIGISKLTEERESKAEAESRLVETRAAAS